MASRKSYSTREQTTWQAYQAAVLAHTDLTPNLRFLFRELASWGNYEDGSNCAPPVKEIAERCGWSLQWTARQLRRLRVLGIIRTVSLRSRAGRWNRNGYQFIGHGFTSPDKFDNLDYLKPSKTPRHAGPAHDRLTGRFTHGPIVTTGDGPKVTIGPRHIWSESYQSDLALESDPVFDPSALARAPEETRRAEAQMPQITSELHRKSADREAAGAFAVDEMLWLSQFDDDQRRALVSEKESCAAPNGELNGRTV